MELSRRVEPSGRFWHTGKRPSLPCNGSKPQLLAASIFIDKETGDELIDSPTAAFHLAIENPLYRRTDWTIGPIQNIGTYGTHKKGIENKALPHLQLLSDCKYGFRGYNNVGTINLIRSAYDPDPYPEFYRHHFRVAISMVSDAEDALHTHLAYGHEILAVPNTKHEGSLALTESMLNLEGNGAYLSALYSNKDGSVTARIFNRLTQENNISLHFPVKFRKHTRRI